jgi:hypothetical protein
MMTKQWTPFQQKIRDLVEELILFHMGDDYPSTIKIRQNEKDWDEFESLLSKCADYTEINKQCLEALDYAKGKLND